MASDARNQAPLATSSTRPNLAEAERRPANSATASGTPTHIPRPSAASAAPPAEAPVVGRAPITVTVAVMPTATAVITKLGMSPMSIGVDELRPPLSARFSLVSTDMSSPPADMVLIPASGGSPCTTTRPRPAEQPKKPPDHSSLTRARCELAVGREFQRTCRHRVSANSIPADATSAWHWAPRPNRMTLATSPGLPRFEIAKSGRRIPATTSGRRGDLGDADPHRGTPAHHPVRVNCARAARGTVACPSTNGHAGHSARNGIRTRRTVSHGMCDVSRNEPRLPNESPPTVIAAGISVGCDAITTTAIARSGPPDCRSRRRFARAWRPGSGPSCTTSWESALSSVAGAYFAGQGATSPLLRTSGFRSRWGLTDERYGISAPVGTVSERGEPAHRRALPEWLRVSSQARRARSGVARRFRASANES